MGAGQGSMQSACRVVNVYTVDLPFRFPGGLGKCVVPLGLATPDASELHVKLVSTAHCHGCSNHLTCGCSNCAACTVLFADGFELTWGVLPIVQRPIYVYHVPPATADMGPQETMEVEGYEMVWFMGEEYRGRNAPLHLKLDLDVAHYDVLIPPELQS